MELLEGDWLTPDPVISWVAHARIAPEEPFDVAAFAARERSAQAADAREVRDALIDALTPADVYRVAWRVGPAKESSETPETGKEEPP